MRLRKILPMLTLALLVASSAVFAQSDPLSGKYKGVARSEALGDMPLEVTIEYENGKINGYLSTAQGDLPITAATFENGKLVLKFDAGGNEGTMDAELKDGQLVGKWDLAGQSGSIELTRIGGATPAASSTPAAADAMVAGDWDGAADVQGQTFPFVLRLKQEGDKLTGSSESDQGTVEISKGVIKGDTISYSVETPQGELIMTGKVRGNMIYGEFDFGGGQVKGRWSAKKR